MAAASVVTRLGKPAVGRGSMAGCTPLAWLEPYIVPSHARAYGTMIERVRPTLGAIAFDAAVAEAALSITQCIDETLGVSRVE